MKMYIVVNFDQKNEKWVDEHVVAFFEAGIEQEYIDSYGFRNQY